MRMTVILGIMLLLAGCGMVHELCIEQCSATLKIGCDGSKSKMVQQRAAMAESECELICGTLGGIAGTRCDAACVPWCESQGFPVESCQAACLEVCGGENAGQYQDQ